MQEKITRRALAGIISAVAAASAQQPPALPPLPTNPDEELTAARAVARSNYEQIAKVKLPIGTEPAVHFKA